ncbi:hypothetical protein [Sphingobium yanoikuyae]|uniref:hypothetical protein n=1 Tax=Sphingobium yanoikuyae TaxID=13690 RepID=UPI00345E68B1
MMAIALLVLRKSVMVGLLGRSERMIHSSARRYQEERWQPTIDGQAAFRHAGGTEEKARKTGPFAVRVSRMERGIA